MMSKRSMDDNERRAGRLQLVMQEFDLTNESAVIVDDLAMNAVDKAFDSLLLVVNSAPNETLRVAIMVHALRITAANAEQSAEMNEVIRAIALDMSRVAGVPLHEVLASLGARAASTSAGPVPGDSCECPACLVRRSVVGADPGYDAVKKSIGDPGVKLSDIVRGLFGGSGGKGKPH